MFHKKAFFVLLFVPLFALAHAEEKSSPKVPTSQAAVQTSAQMSYGEAYKRTGDALCKKMEECSVEKIPQEQCLRETTNAFVQAYEALPKNKQFEIKESQTQACVLTISKSTCAELQQAQKLPGCEYIEKLNP